MTELKGNNLHIDIEGDIGNDSFKGFINGEYVKMKNVYQSVYSMPNVTETNNQKNVINLIDNMFVNIASKSIRRSGMYFIGNRAMLTGKNPKNMNIKVGQKYNDDLPLINILSLIANKSVQLEWEKTKKLPQLINVTVDLISAIPASQWTPVNAKHLEKRFTSFDHVVVVYVGEEQVTVTLTFNSANITQEGVPPLYAILEGEEEMFTDFIKLYKDKLAIKNINGSFFKNKKILHCDIGDGTTEYIYTVGVNPIIDACSGERRGVGHATEEAVKLLNQERGTNIKRQQFSQILQASDHKYYEEATGYFNVTKVEQAELILEDTDEKYVNNTASEAEILCIYGGGGITFKDELYNQLLDYCNRVGMYLLWIPEKYAVDMNARGMQVIKKILTRKKVR
ncbi:ParM/StbA family protein [Bacillus cereus]|uniref:ParM/StbA family protein n=1 Tax=Bacillus cereus TaxID=1396 RepID=UPI000C28D1A1|nr:ParM/StbA family protein [Bacillus cereus]